MKIPEIGPRRVKSSIHEEEKKEWNDLELKRFKEGSSAS